MNKRCDHNLLGFTSKKIIINWHLYVILYYNIQYNIRYILTYWKIRYELLSFHWQIVRDRPRMYASLMYMHSDVLMVLQLSLHGIEQDQTPSIDSYVQVLQYVHNIYCMMYSRVKFPAGSAPKHRVVRRNGRSMINDRSRRLETNIGQSWIGPVQLKDKP